ARIQTSRALIGPGEQRTQDEDADRQATHLGQAHVRRHDVRGGEETARYDVGQPQRLAAPVESEDEAAKEQLLSGRGTGRGQKQHDDQSLLTAAADERELLELIRS